MQFESSMFVTTGWKRMPFVRLIVPLLAGITTQLYTPFSFQYLVLLAVVGILLLLLLQLLPLQYRYSQGFITGLLLYLLVYCAGGGLVYISDIRHQQGYFEQLADSSSYLLLQIDEPLQEKPRSFKTTARVTGVYNHGRLLPAKGHLLLYFSKGATSERLRYGDRLMVLKKPVLIKNSGNPGAFNYQQYCASLQTFHQLYLKASDYYHFPRHTYQDAGGYLLLARTWCLNNLKRYIGEGPEAGMAAALLIGYRQELDRDIVSSYSNTGIVHIIAISGMHLALLYGSLLWLLQWLPAHRYINVVKAILVLLALWGFALLTGASASVLRAAVMFTGITVGRYVLSRHASIYNTLAASAFLLLCYNPWLAIDAGFQLSYLAVLSILLFYRPLCEWWQPRKQWLKYGWQMAAVTLAAQLLTTPVSIYYFHQFPNYFLPANLVAVPLSTIIIYGEALLLLISPFDIPAGWIGMAIHHLISWMNTGVAWLGNLPFALISGLQLSIVQVLFFYLLMAGMTAWLLGRYKAGLWAALISCWVITGVYTMREIHCLQQKKLIIYNVPGYTAIDCIRGKKVLFSGNDSIWHQPAANQLLAARSLLGVQPGAVEDFRQQDRYIHFGNKRLVVLNSSLPPVRPAKKYFADYILITGNPPLDVRQVKDLYDYNTIILGAANPAGKIRKWKSDCYVLTLRCFSVPDQGAYVINF